MDPNSFEIVNGNNYLICDKNDDLQVKACLFYCRVQYYPYGECVNQNNFQICKCETPITPTTTSAIPNTTYNSNITVSFGPELQTLTGHKGAVYALAVLKNGDLASASWNMTIKIWNLNDGSIKRTLDAHDDDIPRLAV